MNSQFQRFLQEKMYLQNVSPHTVRWYRCALKWLPGEQPTGDELKDMVIRMRQAGLKATGCNAVIRAVNCYLRWSGNPHRVQKLKEPVYILPTFTTQQVNLLIRFRPQTEYERRLHLLSLLLLDTGCRISEALSIRRQDVDLDNLLLTLRGKGDKARIVPISLALRKELFKYGGNGHVSLFHTSQGTGWARMSCLRSVKLLCRNLGFKAPARTLHAFRHTFAINYLRRGGSVFHLQKILGHSSLEMTRRYVNLVTDDLQAVHQRLSLLAA